MQNQARDPIDNLLSSVMLGWGQEKEIEIGLNCDILVKFFENNYCISTQCPRTTI